MSAFRLVRFAPSLIKAAPHPRARANLSTRSHENAFLVVNSLGLDRTGIVSEVSKLVTDAGGNVGESHASKVGTYFSLTLSIHVPRENLGKLQNSLAGLTGMSTNCIEAERDPNVVKIEPSVGYSGRFVLEGVDDLGLVHKVTSLLAKYHLSIDTMETSDEIAPHGGTTLFRIDGIATGPNPLPKSFEPDGIREELGALGDSLNVDITLKDNITRRRVGWRS